MAFLSPIVYVLENNNAHHSKSLFICISKKNNQNDNIEARLFEKTLSGWWFQFYGKYKRNKYHVETALKVRYSEKATKFEKIFHLTFDATE